VIGEKNLTILKIKPYLIVKNVVNSYRQIENMKLGVVGVRVSIRNSTQNQTFYA
jgi:hypothetical protein